MWARREIRGLLSRHANSNPRLSAFFHFIARGPKHLRCFSSFKLNSFITISREPRFSSLLRNQRVSDRSETSGPLNLSTSSPSKNITRILLGLMQTFSFEEKGCMIKGRCSTRLSYRPAPRPGFEPGSEPLCSHIFRNFPQALLRRRRKRALTGLYARPLHHRGIRGL